MRPITWVASYPKSGNTWMRAVLTNCVSRDSKAVGINDLSIPNAARRDLFDLLMPVDSSELTDDELDACRADAYRLLARTASRDLILKIHDAYCASAPVVPADATRAVIYIVRDPRDVAVSFAHHRGVAVSEGVRMLNQEGLSLTPARDRGLEQVRQRLGTWSEHVTGWTDQSSIPILVVRYEDLLVDPHGTFGRAVAFAGLNVAQQTLAAAIRHSSFARLQQQESEHGFRERPAGSKAFFRAGKAGGWRDVLTPAEANTILEEHGPVMARLGYTESPDV